ncbi:hypothetical protein [Bradyrhizobium sp. HKCCYLS3013]|uniref:hypothetical protein n=1 Tax=Bradyrhizobium sp. HKCCYLS3013 TaxID=3420735 RepID=UPI003EBF7867
MLAGLIQAVERGGEAAQTNLLFLWTLREASRANAQFAPIVRSVAAATRGRLDAVASALRGAEAPSPPISPNQTDRTLLDQLNLTLIRARRTTGRYADSRFPAYISSLEAYREFPTLERAEIEDNVIAVCAAGAAVDFFTATSATTTGRPLLVPHNRSELDALTTFSTAHRPEMASASDANDDPFGLTLRLMPSGRLIGAPMDGANSVLATYDTNAIRENVWDTWDYIISQVFVEFPTAKGPCPVETIHATPAFGLILLTKYMVQRGLDPSQSNVKQLLVTGSWIGPTTRRWLERTWKVPLYTTYSCSELIGSAVECGAHPGRYHFSSNIFPEVLDDHGQQVDVGSNGRIHLTGLYPFHQAAVLMRYNIGDWGRWHGSGPCTCGDRRLALDMLGRTRDVLTFEFRSGRKVSIAPVPVRNALDRFDYVPRIPRPQYRLRIVPDTIPRLEVDVECFSLAGPVWRETTRNAIAAAILEEDAGIAELVENGEVTLEVRLFFRSGITQLSSVI